MIKSLFLFFFFFLIADLLLLLEMGRRADFLGDFEAVADKLEDDFFAPGQLHETKQETRHPASVSS